MRREINCSCGNGLCEDCARDMRAAIVAVRQLHRPVKPHARGIDVCNTCSSVAVLTGRSAGVAYPCATVRVLDDRGA